MDELVSDDNHWSGWAFDESDALVPDPACGGLPPGMVLWVVVCRGVQAQPHAPAVLCHLFDRRKTVHSDVMAVVLPTWHGATRADRQTEKRYFFAHYPLQAECAGTLYIPRCQVGSCKGGDDIRIGQERLAWKLGILEEKMILEDRVVDAFLFR